MREHFLQTVCPSEGEAARNHLGRGLTVGRVGQNLDSLFIKVLNYCPCFVEAGTVVVDEDVLGTFGLTLIFHLLDRLR